MTSQRARHEAERCLYCFEAPCTAACPVHMDIPGFIAMLRSGNVRGAAEVVKQSNPLANVCGNVCPEEVFCQSVCNRAGIDTPVNIRELHLYATRHEARESYSPLRPVRPSGKRAAVVGAGPAGLACAFELAMLGHVPTIFDKGAPGGVPKSSIPAFRLPAAELEADLRFLSVHFTFKQEEVDDARLDALRKEYDAVFLAIGLGTDRPLCIQGERLTGVTPVLRFLNEAKSNPGNLPAGARTVVIGGGNVSLDAAATARRLGSGSVLLVYRRSEHEMKVWKSELSEARKQGVEFSFLTVPVEIVGDGYGNVTGVRCRKTRLSDEHDSSGRPIPVEIEGSEQVLPADRVIIAIGQDVTPGLFAPLARNWRGYLEVDKSFQTGLPGLFAGGDAIAGEGTIVQSVAQGKEAAHRMHEYLKKRISSRHRPEVHRA